MKLQVLTTVLCVALFAAGCSSDPEEQAPPPEVTTRVVSSLERTLDTPVAVPSDGAIGQLLDAVIEERSAALALTARQPVVKIGVSGARCFVQSFDDADGHEAMRRDKCESDVLRVGTLLYTAAPSGKIERFAVEGAKAYEVFDDDRDGKVDRILESADRMTAPVLLSDFGPDVTIVNDGKVDTRTREDRDHDGRFDHETITATTMFKVVDAKAP